MKLGLDVFGGDYAPKATVEGAIKALKELPNEYKIVLIGDENSILPILKEHQIAPDAFEIVHTSEQIAMNEHPVKAFTKQPNSSISIGFKLLHEKKIDAFSSAGNSGALLVGAMYTVKPIPGVIRPSITTAIPRQNGKMGIILDVGINADCKPDVMYQFAILGSIYAEEIYGIKNPKVGLLNIGEEKEKGNLLTLATHELMSGTKDFNFIGNVEGRDLFSEHVDVIVCEGFVGNVILKSAEAFYNLIKERNRSDEYLDRFNYELYGGTPILGVNGNVILGHGISSSEAVKNMIKLSGEVVKVNLYEKILNAFSK
jgi:glycerol-3-phosphate acyltransferase PlsX